jgi:micrococcal nuclease
MGLKVPGTFEILEVIDGDTFKVSWEGERVNLRLPCIDTEETRNGSPLKPVTLFGKKTTEWAKKWLADRGNEVEIEYEADYAVTGFYDRALTYVTAGGENFNLECVRKGYSPYFHKYGYSRGYHEAFVDAERAAMRDGLGIWDDAAHAGDATRPYHLLKMWWEVRARQIEMGRDEKRRNNRLIYLPDGLDYEEAVSGAERQEERQVFGEVGGIREIGPGTVIEIKVKRKEYFNLYVFEDNSNHDAIVNYLKVRHLGEYTDLPNGLMKQNFIFVSGELKLYHGKPEVILRDIGQLKEDPF